MRSNLLEKFLSLSLSSCSCVFLVLHLNGSLETFLHSKFL
uniref:Uncharacterized protein n=1 Tax=Arundo donax TaxID=35708 RepID=A0A0A9SYE1_ARUDO